VRSKLPTLVLALLLGAAVLKLKASDATAHATPPPAVAPIALTAPTTSSYADLVSRVAPSVVTIRSERTVRPARQALPPDDFFRRFFGDGDGLPSRPRHEGALGSGVVVSADGYILTNHHVVEDAQRIEVELGDRRTYTATRVGSDPASDLAVLRIQAPDLRPLPLGDSRSVRVGDVVLAFGNPLGLGPTVTSGIISAKGRATGSGEGFEDFLQTDAPINQGNSGGALVNMKGELVGINSQIVSPSGGNIGIGFAIPSSMADDVMQQLIRGGKVHRGQLGVSVQAVSSDIARSLGMKDVRGALVSAVVDDSPAARAGVKRGDVILALNGNPVSDGNSLRNEIAGTKPGSTVNLTIRRNRAEQTLAVTLGELTRTASRSDNDDAGPAERGRLGLRLRPLTRDEAAELGLDTRRGLLVADVSDDSPAAEAGFHSGDVIQEVDGRPVADAEAFRAAVKAAGDRPALVLVSRNGDNLYLPLGARG
jgi:Do/DeqQ family serine protease